MNDVLILPNQRAQDLSEVEAQVEAEMRLEPDYEQLDESQSDDAPPPTWPCSAG
jgi:hypothetical protein